MELFSSANGHGPCRRRLRPQDKPHAGGPAGQFQNSASRLVNETLFGQAALNNFVAKFLQVLPVLKAMQMRGVVLFLLLVGLAVWVWQHPSIIAPAVRFFLDAVEF